MLSEKPWRFESVLKLAGGILLGLVLGMSAGPLLQRLLPNLSGDQQQFLGFVISSLSFHGVALVLTTQFLNEHLMSWKHFLDLNSPLLGKALQTAFAAGVLVLPLAWTLSKVSEWLLTSMQMEPVIQQPIRILEKSVSPGQRICFAVVAVGIAPVVEETLFRGILYPVIKQKGYPRFALWSTALLFAAIHANLLTFLPLAFLAVVLTLLYEKTDTLAAPVVTHSLFNAVNFIVFIYREPLSDWLTRLLHR